MTDSPFIFEADSSNFEQYVIQNSHQVLILVDFWADWCQPCQMLMPVLSKVINEYQGQVILVKVNSDQNQALSARYGVRSLPTVKVFKRGEMVDGFTGVQAEGAIRQLINKHRIRPTEPYRQQALSLYQQGDSAGAMNLLQQVLQHEPDFHEAMLDLASMQVKQGEIESAEALLASIPQEDESLPQDKLNQLLTDIKLAKLQAQADSIDTSALMQRLAENPQDWDAHIEMAQALIAGGQFEKALEHYLIVMRQDPSNAEGAGRKGLMATFELLGANHLLVKKFRGKMFSLLY